MAVKTDRPALFDGVARRIEAALVEHDLPSVAVAVAHGGEIVWEGAFGWADREQRHPSADARGTRSTVHSLYSLGSISKPFTTTALMILVERGLIDLDAPANEYLAPPGIVAHVGDAREATVRRLADHTAGLPLHWHYFYDDERERPPPMEETIRRYGHLVTPPGERYQYANMGYGIVGHIVERVSGMPYAEFMRREIFAPLGLRHASVWIDPRLAAHTVKQYGADGIAYPPKVTDHPGAGSVWASVHDVMRFALFHLKQPQPDQAPVVSDAGLDLMQTPTADVGDGTCYGLGWSLCGDRLGYRVVGHEGGSGGVATLLWLFPDEKMAVAALTNSSRPNPMAPAGVVEDLAAAVLPRFGQKLAERRKKEQEITERNDAPRVFEPPAELVGDWQGVIETYEGQAPFGVRFAPSGEVWAQLAGEVRPVIDVDWNDGYLTGTFPGAMPTSDAARRPHRLQLDLKVRGDALTGAVIALAPPAEEGGAPERRLGFALSHWTELHRQP